MKRSFFHRHSVFLSFLVSYLMLMFIPILISAVVHTQAEGIIEDEVNKVNMMVMKQVRQNFDNGLNDVLKFVFQVGLNPKIGRLIYLKSVPTGNDYYLTIEIEQELRFYKTVNGFVDDFYVYFMNMDRILSSSGLFEKEMFYEYSRSSSAYYDGLSYENWLKVIKGEVTGEFIPLDKEFFKESAFSKSVIYSQSVPIPVSDKAKKEAVLVVLLNDNRFIRELKDVDFSEDVYSMILDKNNRVLFSSGSMPPGLTVNYGELAGEDGLIYKGTGDEDCAVSYITSQVNDWKYVTVIPSKVFREKTEYIRRLTLISFLFCILVGGVAAYMFSRRNYNPISELVRMLEKATGALTGKKYNELRFLYDTMRITLSEKEKVDKRLEQQNMVLRANFLTKLLKGKIEDENFINSALSSYNINFETKSFAVMLFYIVDFEKLFENDREQPYEERLKLVQFIITNIIEEMVEEKNQGFMTEADDMLACIINLREDVASAKKELMRIAREASEIIKTKFHINLIISLSDIHETIYGIPEAYQEALNVMEYKIVTGNNSVISYDEIRMSKGTYEYTIEKEHQLINCVKAGDFSTAQQILNEVVDDNITGKVYSTDLVKCLMFDLVSTMLKTLPEISFICDDNFLKDLNISGRLLSCESIHEMKNEMVDMLRSICDYIQGNRKNKKEDLIEKVKVYINETYGDANLTVAGIADTFNLTPAYLTRLFKEYTSEGLFDYICKVRMEKAKKFLSEDQSANIKDIAIKVGYTNTNTFIRTFKKYEGITPGLYKDVR